MNAHVSCNVANCQSSYNNVYSLIRHMRKIHDESSTSNLRQDTSTPPVENSEIEMNEDRNVVDEIAPILNSSSENVPDESHDAPEESVDPDLSSEKLSTMVLNCALLFVTQLYAFSGTNRAAVHAIITSMCAMYIGRCFEFLQKKVRGGSELDNMFNIIKNGFKMFKTEYLTFKYLQKIGCLFLPTKITIQSCYAFRKRKFRSRRVIRKRRMSVIQIDEVLKKFLELPGVFSAIEENVNVSTADPSPSFFNGSYWKSISTKFVGKTVLPLVMYFDDFEINNPLGSRKVKSKIGAVYCSVLGIPPRFASQLENILLVQLHKYSDHKQESCVFNEISNFHVANNPSVDPMHDLLEGVCRVDVGRILNYLINVKKYFEFSVLEERMECYSKNSPDSNLPSLSRESMKNERIVTSASEMYYLVFNLPLMIGDLVPSSDRAWQLFLLLRKITCIVFAHSVTHEQINSFGNLVTSYLNLYKALFKKTFRPKHHILLHYKRLMLKYGPLKILSCFRYEAKHRQLKQCSGATTSRVCPDYTIGVKHQLQLCYRFVKGEGFLSKIEYSPVLSKLCDVKNLSCLTNLVPNNLLQSNCYSWIRTGGTYYSLGCFINTHGIDGFPKFGKIEHIIVDDSERVYFVFKKTSISQINQKLSAYEIHEKDTYGCVEQSSLKDYECYYGHKMTDGKLYVPRYFY
ncbi:hypothetical protein QAD02_005468 [Eretmocerus hayati]|uniref:Uncharacterized protein n=1 Tax=Eretmocerus hayati TaxID=131215 RepID=A0ACC2NTP2_9HYME|nr:hypothetical protein QAD02_005468 [Eretmocerus hayati]